MANKHNESAQSQGGPGQPDREHDQDGQTERGPGEGQRSAQQQQQVELPEHQGVMTDYVPPNGGMRNEVGDIDVDDEDGGIDSAEAGDEPLPGHMGGGLAGG